MPIRLAVSTVVPAPGTRPAHQARELSRPSKQVAEPACKPGSVVDSHSSGRAVTGALEQPTRRHRGPRHRLPIWSCSRWGLPCRPVARLAVRSYRTVSPLPRIPEDRSAVCSLLHFPSARAAQALPGTVPCGARTFLGTLSGDATVWPTPPAHCTRTAGLPSGSIASRPAIPAAARSGVLMKICYRFIRIKRLT